MESEQKSTSVKELVAERLANSGDAVKELVIEKLVDDELEKRKQLVLKGVDAVDNARKDLSKIKPDQTSFDVEGQPVGTPAYSRGKLDELNKAKQKLAKLEGALNKALENNDYQELEKVLSQGGENKQ
jgi:hypothetical protein